MAPANVGKEDELLRIRHRAGTVHVEIEVEWVRAPVVPFTRAPDALHGGDAGNDARDFAARIEPVRIVERMAEIPGFETFRQRIGALRACRLGKGIRCGSARSR